jgi:hypothetical protein
MLTTLEVVPICFAYLVASIVKTGSVKPILINLNNFNENLKLIILYVCIVTDIQSQNVIEKVTGMKFGTDFHDKSA